MPAKKSSKAKAKSKNLRPKAVSNDQAASVKGGAFNAYLVFTSTDEKESKPAGGSSSGAGSSGSW
jgi:hypothetical protein